MSEEVDLLPRNATEFEKAVSLASANGADLPAYLVSFAAAPDETIGGYAYNLVRPSLTPVTTWPERVPGETENEDLRAVQKVKASPKLSPRGSPPS